MEDKANQKHSEKKLSNAIFLSSALIKTLDNTTPQQYKSQPLVPLASSSSTVAKGPGKKPTFHDAYMNCIARFRPESRNWRKSVMKDLEVFDFNDFDVALHLAVLKNFLAKNSTLQLMTQFMYTSFGIKEYFKDSFSSHSIKYKSVYKKEYEEYVSTTYQSIVNGIITSLMPVEINAAYIELWTCYKNLSQIPLSTTSKLPQKSIPTSISLVAKAVPAKKRKLKETTESEASQKFKLFDPMEDKAPVDPEFLLN